MFPELLAFVCSSTTPADTFYATANSHLGLEQVSSSTVTLMYGVLKSIYIWLQLATLKSASAAVAPSKALQTRGACWKPRKHKYRYYIYTIISGCILVWLQVAMPIGTSGLHYVLYKAVITLHSIILSVTVNFRSVITLYFIWLVLHFLYFVQDLNSIFYPSLPVVEINKAICGWFLEQEFLLTLLQATPITICVFTPRIGNISNTYSKVWTCMASHNNCR